ncbi:phosphopantetheine-binding protein [Thiopseudomonas alkaliphila]|uniref:Acyl carrier protein n=1 Tax=Thiopseudomonas alkaliphila TaxID=1697053 RepID=A0A0K1XEE6_9GAMM|nr:phosphopantetheine-binding protein [Thiopseudomonas alkaliphila]AKX59614.1 acyl carrier protein [Thiopseudomonas alkaliphila]MDM1696699.1 acyl carrier protein [Thiopseudomonas alkaliphila]MDM1716758.1 acyl carrier protein [Thiopseudomonas alkaliphila]
MTNLISELKQLVIDSLGLEDITTDDIEFEAPLFGDGLGLDSVDALELGLAVQKKYGIKIDAESKDVRSHFASIKSLAEFIQSQQAAG